MPSRLRTGKLGLHITCGPIREEEVRRLYQEGLNLGADDERERLRPLLERCRLVINMLIGRAERISEPDLSQIEKLLAELEKE